MKRANGSTAFFGTLTMLIALCFISTGASVAHAADLLVDGTSVTLSGEHSFDDVSIINGGRLYVAPYDASGGTGILVLIADHIYIDPTSAMIADGRGYKGVVNSDGEGPGGGQGGTAVYDGGGGGAYGGDGGRGIRDGAGQFGPFDGAGGLEYGNAVTLDIRMGSAGGSAGTRDGDYGGYGGNGGGAVWLEADVIENAGLISADGYSGKLFRNDASGGGAGGGILLVSGTVINTGTLRANGGSGGTVCGYSPCSLDDGGGGGGGGRIKVFYGTLNNTGDIYVTGAAGSRHAEPGEDGTIYFEQIYTPVVIDIKPGSNTNPINIDSRGVIPVAILTTDEFDAADVDPATVLFGPLGAYAEHYALEDVDYDGDIDLILHFRTQHTGIAPEDTEAVLTGETYDGQKIEGSDSVRVLQSKGRRK